MSNVVDFYGSTDFNWWWENNFGGAPPWDDLDNYFTSRRCKTSAIERLNILRWFDRYLKGKRK